ncbi:MAG: hypothetical protein KAT76_08270, partial [Bacteroidales bacterium]|nr:hypothetical protein [Bacteroidales bacterium]
MAKKKYRPVPRYYGFRIYAISTILFLFLVSPITGILLIKHAPDLQKYRTGDYSFNLPDSIHISPDTIAIAYSEADSNSANNPIQNTSFAFEGDSLTFIVE